MKISFNGMRALVTGATKGIGRDIALQLSKCGAEVVAVGRDKELLDRLSIEASNIESTELDLTDWKNTEDFIKNIQPIDLLVNNAAVCLQQPLPELTEEDVERVVSTNLKAVINVTRLVISELLSRNAPGSIVNISSQASLKAVPNHAVYGASKAGVDSLTRTLARDLGPYNIRVNSVNPTAIMTERAKIKWSDPKTREDMIKTIPLRRFGEIREVTDAVLFLLSDKSSMITGVCLPVDGGSTCS